MPSKPKVQTRFGRRHKPCPICKKFHAPWWASAKGRWVLDIKQPDGSYDRKTLSADHDEAIAKWHRIEAGLEKVHAASSAFVTPVGVGDAILIGELASLFLAKLEKGIEKKKIGQDRFNQTKRYVVEFVRGFGGHPVADLRLGGVELIEDWMDEHPEWGSRADVVSRIRQLFNWSVRHGILTTSPVLALEKPQFGKRVTWFTPEHVEAILANCNAHFADGFNTLLYTGARPEEICSLESEEVHEDLTGLHLMIEDHKKRWRTGKPRRVYLVPEAEVIIRRLLNQYPTGRLFRSANKTSTGVYPPMSPEYFCHAFREICRKPVCEALGLNEFKWVVGKDGKKRRKYKYVPYCARHTAAVRWLTGFYPDKNGKPIILSYEQVAALLGNTARMVEEIYGHLVDQAQFLTDRLHGKL